MTSNDVPVSGFGAFGLNMAANMVDNFAVAEAYFVHPCAMDLTDC